VDRHVRIEALFGQHLLSALDFQIVLIAAYHDCPAPLNFTAPQ